jgi:nitroreductase
MPGSESTPADAVDATIRARRTTLLVDPERSIPRGVVDHLVGMATWAPNHKRTWPWRFTVVEGDARGRFGAALAEVAEAAGQDPAKVTKLRTKYERSPVVVLVWVQVDPEPIRAREDRDATAAGVQNLLLSATAHGLGSYWATLADALLPAARSFAGVGDDHDLVALVYLGMPTGEVTTPDRPAPDVTHLA